MSDGTIVVNVKHNTPNYVYIGRPSKWGNPFHQGARRPLAPASPTGASEPGSATNPPSYS